ncbi:MAG: ribose 5-phosphate isomerase A [Acidimicrobiales bacterium]
MVAEGEKRVAAEAAAALVAAGMTVGLGTGSTVAYLLPALANLPFRLRCVASSPRTEAAARQVGLEVEPFGSVERFDLAIDGADQVAPDGWLVKGGGAAHTREKIVAATAERFVVVVDSTKQVERLRSPVPLELLAYGLSSTVRRLGDLGPVVRRPVGPSPDGGVIADYLGPVADPEELAGRFDATPGVVAHGLFPPAMVSAIVVGREGGAEWLPATAAPATGTG